MTLRKVRDSEMKRILVIDERLLTVSLLYENVAEKYKIVACNKHCSLFRVKKEEKIKKSGGLFPSNKISYFLVENSTEKIIWESEQIDGWFLE